MTIRLVELDVKMIVAAQVQPIDFWAVVQA